MRMPTNTILLLLILAASQAEAELDLRNATIERLDNGLTLILLEDRNFPVASVQMLYRVGARDETAGKTGLAHFLEHMAFRASENFPGTELVSSIYARGGEWHGYTWIDQTTYFATVPKEHLDLLLRIEADRMTALEISAADMEAERGAVLAEMHMYDNDPASMLTNTVNYLSFLGHPYRNNTIGWESDIENLQHRDVVDFYRHHYHPGNGVLAVVGDIDSAAVRKRVVELFASFPATAATPLPHTVEPAQNGERRAVLYGTAEQRLFQIGWRAPGASNPDFAAFLVLQSLLGSSSGVNFRQNDWGSAVAAGAILDGAADELTTWFPPSAQDYVFIVGGAAPAGASEPAIEKDIENRIAAVRREAPDAARLAAAIDDVLEQMIFDVESSEDAAHQLAFFEGLGALDSFLQLPGRVAAVTAADVQRVAARYLQPQGRSIAWFLPQATPVDLPAPLPASTAHLGASHAIDTTPVPSPVTQTLSGGLAVIVQPSDLSASVHFDVLSASGKTAASFQGQPQELAALLGDARASLADVATSNKDDAASLIPETRLEQTFAAVIAAGRAPGRENAAPALLVVSGAVDVSETLIFLEQTFGDVLAAARPQSRPVEFAAQKIAVRIGHPIAQAQLGYIAPAAAPAERSADAQQLLLYILSHEYEGRLGKAAITERGLAYYIGSEYRVDDGTGWLLLAIGVDSDKLDALRLLLQSELRRLLDAPPSAAEIAEAKEHFIGRARSAAQSNAELAARHARHWFWYGETQTVEELRRRLDAVSRQDVLDEIPAFVRGTTIVVTQ